MGIRIRQDYHVDVNNFEHIFYKMSSEQSGASKPSLEWMYKPASLVNREDYLLGRTVDKSLKILEEAEKGNANTFNYADEVEKDLTPLSIFSSQGSGPIDVIKKIKEDPLYQIQKKEEESLKQLLKNPVRMKELEERIKERQSKVKTKKSKKDKKKKAKSKKSRRRSSSSSSSSSDSDDDNSNAPAVQAFKDIDKLLSAKLQSLKNSSSSGSGKRKSQRSSSSSSSDSDNRKRRRRYDRDRDRGRVSHSRSHNNDDCRGHGRSDSYDYDKKRNQIQRSRTEDQRPSNYGRGERSGTTTASRHDPKKASASKSALNEEELERKRREMMDNAKWRDDQRTKSVNQYRSEEQKEKDELEKKRDPDFIRKQLLQAAASGSVEKRIKSNSYNIQRSKVNMDHNFMKR